MHAILLCLTLATLALAGDWRVLDDAGILTALSTRMLQYPGGAAQSFSSDGRTPHQAGAGESRGKWWAEAGQDCSTWPPSDVPACCRVDRRDLDLRFSAAGGDVTLGRHAEP